ncbi:MAG: hypothetical protein J0H97_07340 [Alphaproteobacteria bacterium]|nr:hypothetical protein [Alphaproteobacteria bacterium]
MPEAFGVEDVQLFVREGATPFGKRYGVFLWIVIHRPTLPLAATVMSNDLTAIRAHPYKVRMIMNLLQKGWYFTSLT